MKKEYIPPVLEIFEYNVEKGYALSSSQDPNTDIVLDLSDSLENVNEGNNYGIYGNDIWY
jgi:hypothetical protein